METISAEKYEHATGHPPERDDLERCNCDKAGQPGHTQCGWNNHADLPVFMAGVETNKEPRP